MEGWPLPLPAVEGGSPKGASLGPQVPERPPRPLTVEPFGLEEEELSKTGPVTSYL